jgi:UrcA family protein
MSVMHSCMLPKLETHMIAAISASSSSTRARLAIAILAGVMSIGLVTAAQASPEYEAPRIAVKYDDLDISTEKGALKLYSRIVKAARSVCPQPVAYSSRIAELSRKCVTAAVARAVADINSPMLAKVEAERNRRPI